MKKPAIPSTGGLPGAVANVLRPIKENIELLTGVRGGELEQLPTTATLDDVIAKVNEIVARLNGTGE